MNYWIFVHKGEKVDAAKTFRNIVNLGNWVFMVTKPIKNKIMSLRKDDIIVFYLGGNNCKYFAGETKLVTNAERPTRESIGDPVDYKSDYMVSFDVITEWDRKRTDLTNRDIRDKLNFIKNKDNWGMTFGQSIIRITERDYNDIKKLING